MIIRNERIIALLLCVFLICVLTAFAAFAGETKEDMSQEDSMVESILSRMSQDEKVSQMIIPAFRTWNEENVTDLSAVPELAEALQKHQYGGVILFGANVNGTEQTTRLLYDLQLNNAKNENVSVSIPYLTTVDAEGGIVTRITSGTRMTGNMAISATGPYASENAENTGAVIGEEIAAMGFNVDFAPDIDINNNPANPVIGTRSFSDEPEVVTLLGLKYRDGLAQNHIIATFKHFPGHGDTSIDSHIGTPSMEKTYEQLQETELIPFRAVIEDGADMIMTAHITFPLIDEEMTFGDGETKGFYPATMSKKMITDILRTDLGFEGVVITDALEMDAIRTAKLVPGEQDSVEYQINIAEKVINAGVDILLLPKDLKDNDAADFYDAYIEGIISKVNDGTIPQERIDESVARILKLKEKYGILNADISGINVDAAVEKALQVVGSDEHHRIELEIARQAITVLKNDAQVLPIKDAANIVFIGRNKEDSYTINYAVQKLKEENVIGENTKITVDFYFDPSSEDNKLHYTDELKQNISQADIVIGFAKTFNLNALADDSPQYLGIHNAIEDTHAAGGRIILLSDNLPYDSSRYQDADAIVLAYMGSGLDMDPTERREGSSNMAAYNANVVAGIETIFGANSPQGITPVNIPVIIRGEDGALSYGTELLYERGFGLTY